MKLYIPTSGRWDRQETWKWLPPEYQQMTSLVVQGKEYDRYRKAGYDNLLMLPPEIKTVGPTRQWILDHCPDNKMIVMDDDLRFSARISPDSTKLRKSTPEDMKNMFVVLDAYLYDALHVSISPREGNNRHPDLLKQVGRSTAVLGYRPQALRSLGVRFDRVPIKMDFDATLQLLSMGHPNYISYAWAHDQSSNASGGCSAYRTPEMLEEGARTLAALHPGYVKVVEKTTKGAWGGGTRTDVRVQWKKAYDNAVHTSPKC